MSPLERARGYCDAILPIEDQRTAINECYRCLDAIIEHLEAQQPQAAMSRAIKEAGAEWKRVYEAAALQGYPSPRCSECRDLPCSCRIDP